ncbi:MAG: hypothetical protein JWM37_466 [Candidatus Saccharibacteria bacterium]|nr:hypothetical protein [Candidatus Saccharibacteria bacterium]
MKPTKNNISRTYVLRDKPLFGLDIGHDMLRVVQFETDRAIPRMMGYGSILFDDSAIVDGVIVRPELIAKSAYKLFSQELEGDVSTRRVAVSVPVSRALTRAVKLPLMSAHDIAEAVYNDAEQNIPADIENLYLDYTTLRQNDDGLEVFVVAVPKAIVDSYMVLMQLLGLETVMLDTTIGASARLFSRDPQGNVPTVLVDFGAKSTDITIVRGEPVVTGTVAYGGDDVTTTIVKALGISERQAVILKSKYGLASGPVQDQVVSAIAPSLETLVREIRRTIRYYEQRYTSEPAIEQVVIMGGGANMPGMAERLTEQLRLPVRSLDMTTMVDFGHLKHIMGADRMSYVTAAGLALASPQGLFV